MQAIKPQWFNLIKKAPLLAAQSMQSNRTTPPPATELTAVHIAEPKLEHNRKTFLDDGRVVNGAELIDTINTPYDERVFVQCLTWQCSRIMRREFNRMTAKMFFLLKDDQQNKKIQRMLSDIHLAANEIANLGVVAHGSNASTVPQEVRLVMPEARHLLDAILLVDDQLNKMLNSPLAELAEENCDFFFAAYACLKRFLFTANRNRPHRETVSRE